MYQVKDLPLTKDAGATQDHLNNLAAPISSAMQRLDYKTKVSLDHMHRYSSAHTLGCLAEDMAWSVCAYALQCQAYGALLGYYNGALKRVRWDKAQLVVKMNEW